jgi:hypothetical protein
MSNRCLRVISLTSRLTRYQPSVALQERLVAQLKAGEAPDTVLVIQVARTVVAVSVKQACYMHVVRFCCSSKRLTIMAPAATAATAPACLHHWQERHQQRLADRRTGMICGDVVLSHQCCCSRACGAYRDTAQSAVAGGGSASLVCAGMQWLSESLCSCCCARHQGLTH